MTGEIQDLALGPLTRARTGLGRPEVRRVRFAVNNRLMKHFRPAIQLAAALLVGITGAPPSFAQASEDVQTVADLEFIGSSNVGLGVKGEFTACGIRIVFETPPDGYQDASIIRLEFQQSSRSYVETFIGQRANASAPWRPQRHSLLWIRLGQAPQIVIDQDVVLPDRSGSRISLVRKGSIQPIFQQAGTLSPTIYAAFVMPSGKPIVLSGTLQMTEFSRKQITQCARALGG